MLFVVGEKRKFTYFHTSKKLIRKIKGAFSSGIIMLTPFLLGFSQFILTPQLTSRVSPKRSSNRLPSVLSAGNKLKVYNIQVGSLHVPIINCGMPWNSPIHSGGKTIKNGQSLERPSYFISRLEN